LGPFRLVWFSLALFLSILIASCGGTRTLTPLSPPAPGQAVAPPTDGNSPQSTRTTKFVYQLGTGWGDNTINGYRYAETGLLPLPGFPKDLEQIGVSSVYWVMADPLGRFLYVGLGESCDMRSPCPGEKGILVYKVNQETGEIQQSAPFLRLLDTPWAPAILPNGKYAYFRDSVETNKYAIDPVSGALTLADHLALPFDLAWVAAHPSGRFLLCARSIVNGMQFKIGLRTVRVDQETGELGAVGEEAILDVPSVDRDVEATPDGKFLYVTASARLFGYRLNDDGALTEIVHIESKVPFNSTRTDGLGRFLYALRSGSVVGYRIDAESGTLTEMLDLGAATPATSAGLPMASSADGTMLMIAGYYPSAVNEGLFEYKIDPSGRLSDLPGSPFLHQLGNAYVVTLDFPRQ